MSPRIVPNGKATKQALPASLSDTQLAAIYARVSTEDQGKGYSIPTQIDGCQRLAQQQGYIVPPAHVLIDEGISGTTLDRPGLLQLREFVHTRAIAAIIIYDPDRLSRNLGHQLLLAEEAEKAGIALCIVSHPLEAGPEGWLFFQMRGALAEYERAKILERMKRGAVGRIQAGHPWGGSVPLGYRYEEQRAELEREVACLETALAKCDREGARWDEAYAREVISLDELKLYRADIATRRQQLITERAQRQAQMGLIGQSAGQATQLTAYCLRISQQLKTFDLVEKRLALTALDVRVRWTPGEDYEVQGTIPLDGLWPSHS